jgi:hypothetical protein
VSSRPRRAQIHLPPLTGEEAHLLVALLDRAIAAVWRAHGHDMAVFLGHDFPDSPAPPAEHEPPGVDDELF